MSLVQSFRAWVGRLTGYFMSILIIATLGPLLFGYHLAELNPPQDVITCEKRSIRIFTSSSSPSPGGLPQCIPMTPTQFGLVQSIFTLGGLLGALLAGPVSALYGRLLSMRITTVFFFLGPVAETFAPSIPVLAIGRLVSGVGAGASLVVVPIYISEIAPPQDKGFFGAFTQIMTNFGILVAQLLGYFLSHDSMWRIILAAGGVIGLIQLVGLCVVVESPKWLATKGRLREAKRNLRRIRGDGEDLKEEIESWGASQAERSNEEEETLLANEDQSVPSPQFGEGAGKPNDANRPALGIFEVLYRPGYRKATFAVMVVMLAQQLCGINSIVMYGVSLLSSILSSSSSLLNILVAVLNIVVTTSCAPLADTLGRKPCLIMSIAVMGTSSVLLAISISAHIPALSAIAVLLFVAGFGLGLGPIPFILASELTGPEAVGATQSWALAANWIATFIVAQFFPLVNNALGRGRVYYIFAALAAGFAIFVAWTVPETKGKRGMSDVWGWDEAWQDTPQDQDSEQERE